MQKPPTQQDQRELKDEKISRRYAVTPPPQDKRELKDVRFLVAVLSTYRNVILTIPIKRFLVAALCRNDKNARGLGGEKVVEAVLPLLFPRDYP